MLHALARNAHIINFYFEDAEAYTAINRDNGQTIKYHNVYQPSILDNYGKGTYADNHLYWWQRDIDAIATLSEDRDFISVWDAGNYGWHEGGSVSDNFGYIGRTPENIISSFAHIIPVNGYDYAIADANQIYGITINITQGLTTISINITTFSHYGLPGENDRNFVFSITGGIARRINGYVSVLFTANQNLTLTANGSLMVISAFSPNVPSHWGLSPRYKPELVGKWLVAIAVSNNGTIAAFSNGCGAAKYWCLAAPGVSILAPNVDGSLTVRSGTGYAAAHISGALALLKSRFPDMPMSVIAAILLKTADDLGASGVDDIYGHGLINISAAINTQNSAHFVFPTSGINSGSGGSGNSSDDTTNRTNHTSANHTAAPDPRFSARGITQLPNAFAAFGERLRGVRAAVRYLDNHYYDAPVNVNIKARPQLSPMRAVGNLWDDGDGHIDNSDNDNDDNVNFFVRRQDGVLRAAGGRYRQLEVRHHWFGETPVVGNTAIGNRPFFFSAAGGRSSELGWHLNDNAVFFAARGNEANADYQQFGLRWQKQSGRLFFASALSEIREDDTLLGGDFGGVLPLQSSGTTRQADIAAKLRLNNGGKNGKWHLFGNYQQAHIDADIGGLIADIAGLRASGWQAGIVAGGVFRGGDKLRFAIGEEMAVSGGRALLHYARAADAEVSPDTQMTINRGWRAAQQTIDLSSPSRPILSAAYGFEFSNNARLSFGISHIFDEETQAALTFRLRF